MPKCCAYITPVVVNIGADGTRGDSCMYSCIGHLSDGFRCLPAVCKATLPQQRYVACLPSPLLFLSNLSCCLGFPLCNVCHCHAIEEANGSAKGSARGMAVLCGQESARDVGSGQAQTQTVMDIICGLHFAAPRVSA
jgi:hypothetical protein